MRYLKLFMLLAMSTAFVACSDDEESYNSNDVTVGFTATEYSIRENASIVDIPINIVGKINGDVTLTVTAEEYGDNPAKEYQNGENVGNYVITDKTLRVAADNNDSRTVNVQVAPIDDDEMSGNRTFKLTIAAVNGAQVVEAYKTMVVTLVDNEAALYERFAGRWHLSGITGDGKTEETYTTDVVLSGTTDTSKPEYNNIYTVSAKGMFNVGISLDCNFRFRYSFDEASKSGTIGFICGDLVASYYDYEWIFLTDDGVNLTTDDVTAPWVLGEDNSLPTEIVFPADATIYLYQPGAGYWRYLTNMKLTR